MWDQLPELILTQIFSYLNRTDRVSVGQVCRSWNRTLSSPALWRSVTVFIDRDLRGDFPLAGELAVREKLCFLEYISFAARLLFHKSHKKSNRSHLCKINVLRDFIKEIVARYMNIKHNNILNIFKYISS